LETVLEEQHPPPRRFPVAASGGPCVPWYVGSAPTLFGYRVGPRPVTQVRWRRSCS
jgi:hypothetical protein